MQCHGSNRAQGVRANFVWVEPQLSEYNLDRPDPKDSHQVVAGERFSHSSVALEINTHGHIKIHVIVAVMQKTPGACHHGLAQEETGVLHVNCLSTEIIFLCVQEQGHH